MRAQINKTRERTNSYLFGDVLLDVGGDDELLPDSESTFRLHLDLSGVKGNAQALMGRRGRTG